MAEPDGLSQEIQRLEQSIEGLEDYLHEAELYPHQHTLSGRLWRAVRLFMIRSEVNRQLHYLRLQHRAAMNCHYYSTKR